MPYATAMDNFIILCFVAVFAALVEFACINFIDTFVKNTKQRIEAEKAKEEEEKQKAAQKIEEAVIVLSEFCAPVVNIEHDQNNLWVPMSEEYVFPQTQRGPEEFLLDSKIVQFPERRFPTLATSDEDEFDDLDEIEEQFSLYEESTQTEMPENKTNCCLLLFNCLLSLKNIPHNCTNAVFKRLETAIEAHWGPLVERNFYNNTTEVIWTIDAYARYLFPFVFLILQLIYWTSYLYIM